jgi:hypothetical protein
MINKSQAAIDYSKAQLEYERAIKSRKMGRLGEDRYQRALGRLRHAWCVREQANGRG